MKDKNKRYCDNCGRLLSKMSRVGKFINWLFYEYSTEYTGIEYKNNKLVCLKCEESGYKPNYIEIKS